jgi:hypothetical protein
MKSGKNLPGVWAYNHEIHQGADMKTCPHFYRSGHRQSLILNTVILLILLALSSTAILSTCAQSLPTSPTLLLGSPTLQESRTETVLAPGLTLTTITRGAASKDEYWTISVLLEVSGKPLSVIPSRDQAQQVAVKLKEAGFSPEIREERNPEYKDLPAGTIGYSVRVGKYETKDATREGIAALSGFGYKGAPLFTGEDGDPASGPWVIRVLLIDPRLFQGEIRATHGASISGRTKVTALARQAGAIAAVNAGFFVMFPPDGVPGEPAGLFVDHGKVLSEATNGRITMDIFNRNVPGGETYIVFQPLITTMVLRTEKNLSHRVDGINRQPGIIRNCGGTGDTPTDLPLHDRTCSDANELVILTPEFGSAAPSGEGIEAVVDRTGTVTELRKRSGGSVPDGGMLIQGIGTGADWLISNVPVGTNLRFQVDVTDTQGKSVPFDSNDYAVNGGPGLVAGGQPEIRPVADGLVHSDDPSFFLRWGVRRNPRTMAGIDSQKRILLVTVDGHQPGYSLGLSLVEGARLMVGLGAVTAMNLDGGGSTGMVIKGDPIGSPSDPTGERAVGDAIILR